MMKRSYIPLLILSFLIFSACSIQNEADGEIVMASTATSAATKTSTTAPTATETYVPTETAVPTNTPTSTPTKTPVPTYTPRPTITPSPTMEPIPTATPMATRVTTETAVILENHDTFARSLIWSHDGNDLYVGTRENGLFRYDANTHEIIFISGGEGMHVQALALSPDGNTLAVGLGNDGSIRLVSAETGDLLQTIWPAHDEWPQVLAFSPDGTILASGGDDGRILLWDSATGELIKELFSGDFWVWGMAFTPDGRKLIAGFDVESTFRVWNTATWELERTFIGDFAADLAISPDGQTFVTAGGGQREANLWSFNSGERIFELREAPGWVWAVDYHPTEPVVASGGIGEIIILWDTNTGLPIRELYMGGDFIQTVAFSPDGSKLASAGGEIIIWDLSEQ